MSKKPESRKDAIIVTAIDLLVEGGHGALSIDRVAQALEISKGNLTYHFPTKDLLVRAMFDKLIDDTQALRARATRRPCADPLERFYRYIDFQLSLRRKRGYDAQSWETYAFSAHNRYVRGRVMEMIESYVQELTAIIATLSPELPQQECRRRSIMINALLRGMLLFTGYEFGNKRHNKALTEQARSTAAMIAGLKSPAPGRP